MLLRTLASGSSGNSILVKNDDTSLLIDAGISCKKIVTRLKECNVLMDDINGILITHEHSDHIAGLRVLLKNRETPLYATLATCREILNKYPSLEKNLMVIEANSYFDIGNLTVTAFKTPHDAVDSVGYTIVNTKNKKASIATDLGYVTRSVRSSVVGSDVVLLEANYDLNMLRNGSYPYQLQERIAGKHGHLQNEVSGSFATELVDNGTKTIMLGHLSKENNTPALALKAVSNALNDCELKSNLFVAPRDALSQEVIF